MVLNGKGDAAGVDACLTNSERVACAGIVQLVVTGNRHCKQLSGFPGLAFVNGAAYSDCQACHLQTIKATASPPAHRHLSLRLVTECLQCQRKVYDSLSFIVLYEYGQ